MDNKDTSNFLASVYAIKLEDYLGHLGIRPTEKKGQQLLYPSLISGISSEPFRIDLSMNRFFDQPSKRSGSLIDFGQAYHQESVGDFLTRIRRDYPVQQTTSIHPLSWLQDDFNDVKIKGSQQQITDPALQQYLADKRIPQAISAQYCEQVELSYYGENFKAVGLKNDSGAYALMMPQGKTLSSPLDITTIDRRTPNIDVFINTEDFLNLSKQRPRNMEQANSAIVLHNMAHFEKARITMEKHNQVNLYFEHSPLGREYTEYAKWLDSHKYKDFSQSYKEHLSLTDMCISKAETEKRRLGQHL